MKKIGLMTLDSHSYNYGGVLQEYALCRILEQEGYETEIIDFEPTSSVHTFSCKRSILNLNLSKLMALAARIKRRFTVISPDVSQCISLRRGRFDQFRKKFLKLSDRCTAESVYKVAATYDILVCGSDQIWNPDFNIPEFFLNFGVENQKKIIYAASLGRDDLSKRQLKTYKTLMSGLDFVSVREDNAKVILQSVSDKKIDVVLDPTLLIEQDIWMGLAKTPLKKDTDYIFCYFLGNSYEKQKAAKKASQEMGLEIVTIPFLHDFYEKQSETFGDYRFCEIGPQEFLGLICNANLVLTDSFHATVFSILFRKNFWTFSRDCGTYNMNSRIVTLLRYFDLSDRMVGVDKEQYSEPCKYQKQYEQFEQKKARSLKFLNDAIF